MIYGNLLRRQKSVFVLCLLAGACGRDTNFVDVEKDPSVDLHQDIELEKEKITHSNEENLPPETNEGNSQDLQTMEFTQKEPGKIDILWVIDNSSSMQPLQDSLRNNIAAFIEQLKVSKLDFTIGITSTDVCPKTEPTDMTLRACPGENQSSRLNHRGSLIGTSGKKVLKKGDPQLEQKFKSYANLGTHGSSFEHGLSATKLAVQKSLIGDNEDFLRDDAFLSVVIVSDEEDDGVGLSRSDEKGVNYWQKNLTRYFFDSLNLQSYLNSVKATPGYSVSAIVGTAISTGEPCQYNGGKVSEVGSEYLRMADLSGGIKASICTNDWSHSLQKLGENLQAQVDSVKLLSLPKPDSIEVFVNEQISDKWRYVAGNNSVQFSAGFVPKPGDKVKITYFPE